MMQIADEVLKKGPSTRSPLRVSLPGALITAAITLVFLLLFWNRFAGLRSGNGSFQGGMALLHGLLPYRDYYTAGPPLDQLVSAALLSVFGWKLIVIRGWGVLEHAALAVVLYFWLARWFAGRHAALASIVAIIVSTGDPSNSVTSYGFEAVSFFILSGWFITFASERGKSIGWLAGWSIAAGFCAALSLATKQTLGAGATVGIPFLAFIVNWRMRGVRAAVISVAAFAAGWGLCIGAMLLWLAQIGVVADFLQDVFRKGPSAKASHPSDFVVRAAHAVWGVRWGFLAAVAGLAACWRALQRAAAYIETPRTRPAQWAGVSALCLIPILVGVAVSYAGKWPLKNFASFTILFAFLGTVVLLAYYGVRLLRGVLTERELQIGFLAGISFGIALMISLSWPVLYDMTFPALALMIAAVLEGARGRPLRLGVYAACGVVLFAITCEKLNRPQGFHEWSDPPVRLANTRSSLPELQGMLLPASTVSFVDGTVRIIKNQTSERDKIFVYPEFGVLYTLANRHYPTATDSHNIDVVNDEFARSEAQRLLAARPKVVVYYRVPAWSLKADERLWRNGQPSGQRDLIAAVEQLTRTYHLAASYRLPPNESPVNVYVRP